MHPTERHGPQLLQLTDRFVGGERVVAFSERDYGLYLATYTGL